MTFAAVADAAFACVSMPAALLLMHRRLLYVTSDAVRDYHVKCRDALACICILFSQIHSTSTTWQIENLDILCRMNV